MQKIVSLFRRNHDGDRLVRHEVVPGAEWVLAGEGQATRKFDGTCCMVRDGQLYKRYDAKQGKTPPAGFLEAQPPDPVTGHWPGWLAVGMGPEDRWHRQAFEHQRQLGRVRIDDGTYELLGPKVQGNPEAEYVLSQLSDGQAIPMHLLVRHGRYVYADTPRTFDALKAWLAGMDIEGIVWHHPDGRMVKIKKRDFGLPRKPK